MADVLTTIFEDFEDTTYNFSWTGDWVLFTDALAQAGTKVLKSKSIGDSQSSTATFTFTVPSDATTPVYEFYYRASSESAHDWLLVSFNGNANVVTRSGYQSTWTKATLTPVIGVNTVVFQYSKDASLSSNDDAVYIDSMTLSYYTPAVGVDVSTPYATKQSFTADRSVSYASTQTQYADRLSAVAMSQVLTADRVFTYASQQTLYAPYVDQSYVHAMKQIVYADRITGVLFDITMASASSSSTPTITNTKTTDADFNTGTLKNTAVSNNEVKLAPDKKMASPVSRNTFFPVAHYSAAAVLAYHEASNTRFEASGTGLYYGGATATIADVNSMDIDQARNQLWVGGKDGNMYCYDFTLNPYTLTLNHSITTGYGQPVAVAYNPDTDTIWASAYKLVSSQYDTLFQQWSRSGVKIGSELINTNQVQFGNMRLREGKLLAGIATTGKLTLYEVSMVDATFVSAKDYITTASTYPYYAGFTFVYDNIMTNYREGTSAPYTYKIHTVNLGDYIVQAGTSVGTIVDFYGNASGLYYADTATRMREMDIYGINTTAPIVNLTAPDSIGHFIYDGTTYYVWNTNNSKVQAGTNTAGGWSLPAQVPATFSDMGYDGTNLLFLKDNKVHKVTKTGTYVGVITLPFNCSKFAANNNQYMWVMPLTYQGKLYKLDYNTAGVLYELPSTGSDANPTTMAESNGRLFVNQANPLNTVEMYIASGSTFVSSGSYTASPVDVSTVKSASSSSISWTETLNGGTIAVRTSLDNGTSWTQATNGGSIANASGDLTGKSILVKADLATPDVTKSPSIQDMTVGVTFSALSYVETTQADFQRGTLTRMISTAANQLELGEMGWVGTDGTATSIASRTGTTFPWGMGYNGNDTYWYIDSNTNKVVTWTKSTGGMTLNSAILSTSTYGSYYDFTWHPTQNELYAAVVGPYRFHKVNTANFASPKQSWTGSDLPAHPTGIAYDKDRDIFWVVLRDNTIRKINASTMAMDTTFSINFASLGLDYSGGLEYVNGRLYMTTQDVSGQTDGMYVYVIDPNVSGTVSVLKTVVPNNTAVRPYGIVWDKNRNRMVIGDYVTNQFYTLEVQVPGLVVSTSGTRISPAFDFSIVGTVDTSTIDWTDAVPANTTLTVDTSIDGGTTWSPATKGTAITGLNGTMPTSVMTRVSMTGNGSATPSLQDITVSATAGNAVNVSRTYSMTQAMYVGYSDIHSVSQVMTADRVSTASLAQTITADRITLESTKQAVYADRITLESMQQMIAASVDVSTLYAMKQAMYTGVSAVYAMAQTLRADRSSAEATKQIVTADRTSAYASKQTIYSTPATAYLSTQKWYVGHTATHASQQVIYANQTLPASLSQIISADRTTNYPTSQMSHTTRTGAHALTQSYYVGVSSTHALAQTLFAQRLDSFTLNQFVPMDRVWAHPLSVKIVAPQDKRVTLVDLVAIMEEMDIVFIATKDVGDVALSAHKDTDVDMVIRMAVKEAPLS